MVLILLLLEVTLLLNHFIANSSYYQIVPFVSSVVASIDSIFQLCTILLVAPVVVY